jgi:hypothetical protein
MAARKTHDLAVGREYQTKSGETKKEWVNIGSRIEWDDGGATLMLKRHINLAGFPGEGDVRVSMFEPRPKDGQQQAPQQARNYSQPQASAPSSDFDDSIPF